MRSGSSTGAPDAEGAVVVPSAQEPGHQRRRRVSSRRAVTSSLRSSPSSARAGSAWCMPRTRERTPSAREGSWSTRNVATAVGDHDWYPWRSTRSGSTTGSSAVTTATASTEHGSVGAVGDRPRQLLAVEGPLHLDGVGIGGPDVDPVPPQQHPRTLRATRGSGRVSGGGGGRAPRQRAAQRRRARRAGRRQWPAGCRRGPEQDRQPAAPAGTRAVPDQVRWAPWRHGTRWGP